MRNASMRADRARGWSVRRIAMHYSLSLSAAHRVVADVHIVLPGRWHLARLPKPAPLPVLPLVHRLRAPL